jgi:hypothetical protein
MMASVHVGVDEGLPESFYFQMDEKDVDNFIASLVAANREMTALREYLNLDDEGRVPRNAWDSQAVTTEDEDEDEDKPVCRRSGPGR